MSEQDVIVVNEQAIVRFLERSSFSGILAVYAAYLSYKENKGFSFEGITKNETSGIDKYYKAYLVATNSLGLFSYTTSEAGKIWKITAINPFIQKHVKVITGKKAEKHDSEMDKTTLALYSWVEKVNFIEQYFKK